jgi:N-acetylglucosaminyl-diphospho-decaprenol L-rhamnosyltransferase
VRHPLITLSVVSHGQARLIKSLFYDLASSSFKDFEIVLTINRPEDFSFLLGFGFDLVVIENSTPLGFGDNHNRAFSRSRGLYFAVLNPDLRVPNFDPKDLISLASQDSVGVVAPLVINSKGRVEDSARKFPTIVSLIFRRLFGGSKLDYVIDRVPVDVDWAGGMFLFFRSEVYAFLKGFDSNRFFMYFEDVDICRRLWRGGWRVVVCPSVCVVHDARRSSRKELRLMWLHLWSAVRFFLRV